MLSAGLGHEPVELSIVRSLVCQPLIPVLLGDVIYPVGVKLIQRDQILRLCELGHPDTVNEREVGGFSSSRGRDDLGA